MLDMSFEHWGVERIRGALPIDLTGNLLER